MSKANPRYANGNKRRAIRARWRAIGDVCHLCGKPINYELGYVRDPHTGRKRMHPMAFVVDEIVPVSKGGDPLAWENTQPAHWICNARKGATAPTERPTRKPCLLPQPFDD